MAIVICHGIKRVYDPLTNSDRDVLYAHKTMVFICWYRFLEHRRMDKFMHFEILKGPCGQVGNFVNIEINSVLLLIKLSHLLPFKMPLLDAWWFEAVHSNECLGLLPKRFKR